MKIIKYEIKYLNKEYYITFHLSDLRDFTRELHHLHTTIQFLILCFILFCLLSTTFINQSSATSNRESVITDSLPAYLKVGDIMFCDIKPEILKKIEPIGLGLFFGMPGHANDHCAMYIGDNRFVEASPYRLRPLYMDVVGVVISPFWKIQLWATNFTYATVDTTQEIRDNAVEWAKTQRGRPYQFIVGGPNADPNDETDRYADYWYCSELIWAAYWNNGVKFVVDNGIFSYNATSIWSFYEADNIILYENDGPYANAGGPYDGFVNDVISFNAYESYDPDGSIMKYNWSFGDGNTTYGEYPYHRYSKPGLYNVTLTVKDNGGKFATNTTIASISKKIKDPMMQSYMVITAVTVLKSIIFHCMQLTLMMICLNTGFIGMMGFRILVDIY